jgi:hypothetical protein
VQEKTPAPHARLAYIHLQTSSSAYRPSAVRAAGGHAAGSRFRPFELIENISPLRDALSEVRVTAV